MNNKIFGEKLKNLRVKRGLTRKDLAEGICTEAYIYKIERGDSFPSLHVINGIGKILGDDFYTLIVDLDYEISEKVYKICDEIDYYIYSKKITEQNRLTNELLSYKSIGNDNLQRLIKMYEILNQFRVTNNSSYAINELAKMTKPNFDLSVCFNNTTYYNKFDIKIISMIGNIYYENGELKIAKEILTNLISFLENERGFQNIKMLYLKVLYSTSLVLYDLKEYDFALNLLFRAKTLCTANNFLHPLSYLFLLEGKIKYILSDYDGSTKAFHSFYNIATIAETDKEIMNDDMKSLEHDYNFQVSKLYQI